jgi:tRNA U38,U39,U40 pseudouridine synthase TruA
MLHSCQLPLVPTHLPAAQVCSFYSWHSCAPAAIQAAINSVYPDVLNCWAVEQVPRTFHATFSTQWR